MPEASPAFRTGLGHDIHRLQPGDGLWLSGVKVPCAWAFVAHSDGDVVLHAVVDAILGALALGDIGQWFPNSDAANRNRASREFVLSAVAKSAEMGWRVANLDVTVLAQQPRLSPWIGQMRRSLAEMLGIAVDCVSIKAGTNEECDAVGRGEAIACHAVVMLWRSPAV
jgi:2-C-methyl-D-erythritol 2,4-cyclodiphosphate synthase